MLYFIKSREYYKIGYSDNFKIRLSSYKIHNPDFELIGTREGTRHDEFMYHCYLSQYDTNKNNNTEWFLINDETVINFVKETFTTKSNIKIPDEILNTFNRRNYQTLVTDYYNSGFDDSYTKKNPEFLEYKKYLTIKEINSMRFNKEKLMITCKSKSRLNDILESIVSDGEFYTISYLKSTLNKKFKENNVNISPKASLIEELKGYSVKRTKKNVGGKMENGYFVKKIK